MYLKNLCTVETCHDTFFIRTGKGQDTRGNKQWQEKREREVGIRKREQEGEKRGVKMNQE